MSGVCALPISIVSRPALVLCSLLVFFSSHLYDGILYVHITWEINTVYAMYGDVDILHRQL